MISPLKFFSNFSWPFNIFDKIKSFFNKRKDEIIEDPYITGLVDVIKSSDDTDNKK